MNELEKVKEFEDAVWYKTTCDCGDEEMSIWIEEEKIYERKWVMLSFHYKCGFYDAFSKSWWHRFKQRIKFCWGAMTTGVAEVNGVFTFRDEKHIEGIFEALKESYDKIKNRKK